MVCFVCSYNTDGELDDFIIQNSLHNSSNTLVQLFIGIPEPQTLHRIAELILKHIPNAIIIGATTAGEILQSEMLDNGIVISFATFENTTLLPLLHDRCDYNSGVEMGQSLVSKSIKAAIIFSEGLYGKPEDFMRGINSIREDIVIAGGAAADNGMFSKTFIMHGNQIMEHGIVGVAFDNSELLISQQTSLGWNPIGKKMVVTRAIDSKLYELDGKPIQQIIEKYLGSEALLNLPSSIVEFPLTSEDHKMQIARAPIALNSDGSLTYAGNFYNGQYVRFAIANLKSIEFNASQLPKKLDNFSPEAIWIYSCMGRKAMLGKTLEKEFAYVANIAPTAGFFTYGEFCEAGNCTKMLNLTTTVLAMAEFSNPSTHKKVAPLDSNDPIKLLTNLVNNVSTELEATIGFLNDYKTALDKASIISKMDTSGLLTYANDKFIELSGCDREDLLGKPHSIVWEPNIPSKIFEDIHSAIISGAEWSGILTINRNTSNEQILDTIILPISHNDVISEYIVIMHDITKLTKQEELIRRQKTDQLTGLPNRLEFESDIDKDEAATIALINVDRFKEINRFYGYDFGDKILVELATVIKTSLPSNFKFYRNDGDTFIICAKNTRQEEFIDNIQAVMSKVHTHKFMHNELDIDLHLSLGVSSDFDSHLSKAEVALNRARSKKLDLAIANEVDKETINNNFLMLNILRDAICNNRVVPYFQPIAPICKNNCVVKYEALARIIDVNSTVYSPASFIEIAKQTKYYPLITKIMFDKTFEFFSNNTHIFSINIAIKDIENDTTMAFIIDKIKSFKEPKRVIIEITESESIEDYNKVIWFIDTIKSIGAQVAIDDFCSGYSNFVYLMRLKANILKIDGSIIQNIVTDEVSYKTLQMIVELAHKINMEVVAEFVSSEEIFKKACLAGVDFAQGYYIAKPSASLQQI